MTVDKPAKGGGRKPSLGAAGRKMTDAELIAAAAQAAVQAVMAMQPQTAAAEPARIKPSDLDDEGKADAEEAAEIQAQARRARETAEHANALVKELIPLIVRERHVPVYNWLKGSGTDADLLRNLLAASLAKALPKFREAHGQASASSTNIELLTDTRPVHQ